MTDLLTDTTALWALDFDPELICDGEDFPATRMLAPSCCEIRVPLCDDHVANTRALMGLNVRDCIYCSRLISVCWRFLPIGGIE